MIILNFNKYKIIISGIILGVLYWIIEAIMDKFVFHFDGDLIHHLFFTNAHEIWMRSMVILFIEVSSVYSQIIFNKLKTSEQKLEEKVHLLFDTIPDAFYIIDQETGKILDVNKAAEKMYGYSREEWLQMKNTDVSAEPNKTKKATYKLPSQIPIRYHKKKDGTIFPLEMMVSSYTLNNKRLIIATGRDITERKKSEEELMKYHDHLEELVEERTEALRESEEKFRYFFNYAQVGLFWSRISDGKFLECNDTFAKLVGYDTREECLANYIALEHYVDSNIRDEMLEEIRINNEIKDIEIQVTKRDGTPYWASISARTNLKENRIEGAAIDVTARKEAEQKLKESEEKYRLISENANDLIYIFNERYEFEYINEQAFMKCLGHSKDDLIGKSTIEFIHPADLKRVSKELRKGFKSGRGRSELRIRHKNGTYRWLEVRGTLYIDKNEKRKALLIGRDVTEKKQAEKEIRESEVKYRHLFETSPYFIGLVNSEGILIDCNDAINDILSIHTIEDVVGKSFKEILLLNEKSTHLIPIFEKFIKSIFEGVDQEGFDFRLNRSIGDYIWIHIEGTLIEIEEQKLIQFIMQDITERKRSEQLLQESIEDLARSNAELEQFTYIASHDLKEPLRMISSFAQLLEKRYKDKLDEDANDFIRFITEGVVRMQDLINSLLAYSRIGKYSKEFEKVDLNDVLKDVIDNLSKLINDTNAEVIYDSLPSLFVDKNQLLQVFQNLISNAIKFRRIDPPLVHISSRLDSKHWVFSIRDNGIGIKSKDFERIFIIFQRLHAKDEFGGTGIGLAICKKIIERYGGKIWVESEVGKGSTFYFSIPKKRGIKSKINEFMTEKI